MFNASKILQAHFSSLLIISITASRLGSLNALNTMAACSYLLFNLSPSNYLFFSSNFTISLGFRTFPEDTTFSSITNAGVRITP